MDQLATLALTAYRQRQAIAQKRVAAGTISEAEAEQHLRPWLAIACRLGADLPELQPAIDGFFTVFGAALSETERRQLVADDLCTFGELLATLTHACDKAVARACNDATIAEGRALLRLQSHFRNPERKAA